MLLLAMGTELAPGIVYCGSFGVPHHVAPWEQHRNGGEPVKQVTCCFGVLFLDCELLPNSELGN